MEKAEEEKAGSFVNVADVESRLEKKEWRYSIVQYKNIWSREIRNGFLIFS